MTIKEEQCKTCGLYKVHTPTGVYFDTSFRRNNQTKAPPFTPLQAYVKVCQFSTEGPCINAVQNATTEELKKFGWKELGD